MIIRRATVGDVGLLLRWRAVAAEQIERRELSEGREPSGQWRNPFPRADLEESARAGETWMLHHDDGGPPVATVTVKTTGDPSLWTPTELQEPSRYVHKMTVPPEQQGRDLGGLLLNWIGDRAFREGCRWLRLDAWTSNTRLHGYYLQRGFTHVRTVHGPVSGALFQRPTARSLHTRRGFDHITAVEEVGDDAGTGRHDPNATEALRNAPSARVS